MATRKRGMVWLAKQEIKKRRKITRMVQPPNKPRNYSVRNASGLAVKLLPARLRDHADEVVAEGWLHWQEKNSKLGPALAYPQEWSVRYAVGVVRRSLLSRAQPLERNDNERLPMRDRSACKDNRAVAYAVAEATEYLPDDAQPLLKVARLLALNTPKKDVATILKVSRQTVHKRTKALVGVVERWRLRDEHKATDQQRAARLRGLRILAAREHYWQPTVGVVRGTTQPQPPSNARLVTYGCQPQPQPQPVDDRYGKQPSLTTLDNAARLKVSAAYHLAKIRTTWRKAAQARRNRFYANRNRQPVAGCEAAPQWFLTATIEPGRANPLHPSFSIVATRQTCWFGKWENL